MILSRTAVRGLIRGCRFQAAMAAAEPLRTRLPLISGDAANARERLGQARFADQKLMHRRLTAALGAKKSNSEHFQRRIPCAVSTPPAANVKSQAAGHRDGRSHDHGCLAIAVLDGADEAAGELIA